MVYECDVGSNRPCFGFTEKLMTHTQTANSYIKGVLSGKIPACKWVKLACQRQKNDLERAKKADFPYRFDKEKAEKVCKFIENLPHTKGVWASRGELIRLEPWQCFIYTTLFGWVKKSDGMRRFREAYIEVPRKNGKALAIDTPVATTRGWKAHGELAPGDFVFAPDGKPVVVQAVTSHYPGPCMDVTLSCGEKITAHIAHEWMTVRTWYTKRVRGFRDKRPLPPVETQELAATLRGGARGDFVHRIPICRPLELPISELPLPSYTLGAWLGDGHSRTGLVTVADTEIVERIKADGVPCVPKYKRGAAITYRLSDGDRTQKARDISFTAKLRTLGVLQNKHIPGQYLRSSREQRLELLRGLVDTDGHITKRGQVEIVSIHKKLIDDIMELVNTLGMKPQLMIDTAMCNGKDCGERYRVMFFPVSDEPLAYVGRKVANQRLLGNGKRRCNGRTVVDVQPVGEHVVNCIQVEGGLYLAGRALVTTHNSILGAGTGNYMLASDGEFGAEVYSGASTEKQAWEVFRPAKLMVERDQEMRDFFGIQVNAKSLNIPADMSRFEPVIGKPGDGASPSCALIDEFHEHDTDDLYSTMKTGMGARTQPLAFIITTAGVNLAGPCYAMRSDVTKILEGSYDAPDVFGIIFTLDDSDDWTTEAALRKANPNYGVSVSAEFLLAEQRKAIQSAHLQNNFKTKHLNIWCSAKSAFFNLQELAKCADPTLDAADFNGEECIIGLDLASKIDIAAKAKLFHRDGHYYAFANLYIPEETADDPANKMYHAWAHQGRLTLTPGRMIDYDYIEGDLLDDAKNHSIKEVPFDPWNATQLAGRMLNEGLPMVEYRMTVQNFSEPMKRLEALIKAGRFHYNGCPVLTWMFSNVVAKLDNKDNVFPCKENEKNKIDGVIAILAALGRWITMTEDGGSCYEERGVLTF